MCAKTIGAWCPAKFKSFVYSFSQRIRGQCVESFQTAIYLYGVIPGLKIKVINCFQLDSTTDCKSIARPSSQPVSAQVDKQKKHADKEKKHDDKDFLQVELSTHYVVGRHESKGTL